LVNDSPSLIQKGDFSPVKSKVLTPKELSDASDSDHIASLDQKLVHPVLLSPSKPRKAFVPKGINVAKKKIRKKKPMTIKEPIDTDEASEKEFIVSEGILG
jgi:hypothetical protein